MADDKIVGLATRSAFVPEGEPVDEVIALLEDLLGRARAGEIRAVAVGMVVRGSFATVWTTEGTEYCKEKLVTASSLLNYRMLAALDERGSS